MTNVNSTVRLSIAICTYNRADELTKTLDSVRQVNEELLPCDEILVIDNNSSDHTAETVRGFYSDLPLRYIFEGTQGLSAARSRALKEYENDVIIFFDDDITVLPNCINSYRQSASANAAVGFFGGRIHVQWPKGRPRWLKSYELPMLNGLVGHYDLGQELCHYPPETHLPYGANFALRRTTTQLVGEFDQSLGVNGDEIGRGEESDYFERCISKDVMGIYIESAHVLHRFPTDRLRLPYLFRYGVQKGLVESVRPTRLDCLKMLAEQLCKSVYQLMIGRRDRFYQCVINMGMYHGLSKKQDHPNGNS